MATSSRKRSSSATTTATPSQAALALLTREPPRHVDSVQFPANYLQAQSNAPWQQLEGSELLQYVSEGLEHLLRTRPEYPVAELAKFLKAKKMERDESTVRTIQAVSFNKAMAEEAQKARDEKRRPVALPPPKTLRKISFSVKLNAASSIPFVEPGTSMTGSSSTPLDMALPAANTLIPTLSTKSTASNNTNRSTGSSGALGRKPRYAMSFAAVATPIPRCECTDPQLQQQMDASPPASPTLIAQQKSLGSTVNAGFAGGSPKSSPIQPPTSPTTPGISLEAAEVPRKASPPIPPSSPPFSVCGHLPIFGLLKPVEAAIDETFAHIHQEGYTHVRVIYAQRDDVVYIDGHPYAIDLKRKIAATTGSVPTSDAVVGWSIESLLETNSEWSCQALPEIVQTSALKKRLKVLNCTGVPMQPREIMSMQNMEVVAQALFDKPATPVELQRIAVVVVSMVDKEALGQLLTTAYCVVSSQWKVAQVARLRRADSEALDSRDVEKEHLDAEAKIAELQQTRAALVERQRERDEKRRKLALSVKMQLNHGASEGVDGKPGNLTSSPSSGFGSFVHKSNVSVGDVHKTLDTIRVSQDARGRRRERNELLFNRMVQAERSRAVAAIKQAVHKFLNRRRNKRRRSVAPPINVTAPTPTVPPLLDETVPSEATLSATATPRMATLSAARVLPTSAPSDIQNQEYERDINYEIIKHVVAEGMVKYPDVLMTEVPLNPPLPRQVAVWSYKLVRMKPADDYDVSSEDEAWTPNYRQRTYLPPLTTRHTNINLRVNLIAAMVDCGCDWRKFLFSARVLHAGVTAIQRRAGRMLRVMSLWMTLMTYSALRASGHPSLLGSSTTAPGFIKFLEAKHPNLLSILQHLPLAVDSLAHRAFDSAPLLEEGPLDLAHFAFVRPYDALESNSSDTNLAAQHRALWMDSDQKSLSNPIFNDARKWRCEFEEVVLRYAPPRPPRWSTYATPQEQESAILARQVHPAVPLVLCPSSVSTKILHMIAVTVGHNGSCLPNPETCVAPSLTLPETRTPKNRGAAPASSGGHGSAKSAQEMIAAAPASKRPVGYGYSARDREAPGALAPSLSMNLEGGNPVTTATPGSFGTGTASATHHFITWFIASQHPIVYVTGRAYALVQRCATKGPFANAAIRVQTQQAAKSSSGVLIPKPPRQGVVTGPHMHRNSSSATAAAPIEPPSLSQNGSIGATPSLTLSQDNSGSKAALEGVAAVDDTVPAEHPLWPDTTLNAPLQGAAPETLEETVDAPWLGQNFSAIEARVQQEVENNLSQADGVLGRYVFDDRSGCVDLRVVDLKPEVVRVLRSKRPPPKADDGKNADNASDRRKARQSARSMTGGPTIAAGASETNIVSPQSSSPTAIPHVGGHGPRLGRKDSNVSASVSLHASDTHKQRNSSTMASPAPPPPPALPAAVNDGPVVQTFTSMALSVLQMAPLEAPHSVNLNALVPCTHRLVRLPHHGSLSASISSVSNVVLQLPGNPNAAHGFRMVLLIDNPAVEMVLAAAATLTWLVRCGCVPKLCLDEITKITAVDLEQSTRDAIPPRDDAEGHDDDKTGMGSDEDDDDKPPEEVLSEDDAASEAKPLFATVTLSSAKRDDAGALRRAQAATLAAKRQLAESATTRETVRPLTYIEASKVPLIMRPLACISKLHELPTLRAVDFNFDDAQLQVSAMLVRTGMYQYVRQPIDLLLAVERGVVATPADDAAQRKLIVEASRALESYAILVFLQCYLTSHAWADHPDRTFANFMSYHPSLVHFLRFPKLLEGEIALPVFSEGLCKETDVAPVKSPLIQRQQHAAPSTARGPADKSHGGHHHHRGGSHTARGVPTPHTNSSPHPTEQWPLVYPRLLPLEFDALMSWERRWECPTTFYAAA